MIVGGGEMRGGSCSCRGREAGQVKYEHQVGRIKSADCLQQV